jgi:hypothetical protein
MHPVYRDFFRGRRILEIGSGLGIDGMTAIADGADWTFSDIAQSNLDVVRRVASIKGLSARFHFIGDDLSRSTGWASSTPSMPVAR